LYLVFAGIVTLVAARTFYGYMLFQTHGEWSAPLDDVFIHFDYARSTARGYPFQWSPGNGYSSGNTSILYPFVLALGYLWGFRGQNLVVWAGIVACLSLLALLVAAARLFAPLSRWTKYLAPPLLFSIGALDWSLFSGMEVAFFLGLWALGLRAALRSMEPEDPAAPGERGRDRFAALRRWELGIIGALLVLTRPEGATSLAALALLCAQAELARSGTKPRAEGGRPNQALAEGGRPTQRALGVLARAAAPALAALALQALANRIFTGEFAASGALVKLTLYNPYMTAKEKLQEYLFLLKYVVFRNTEYHFADVPPYGYIVTAFAAVPLFARETRRVAVALWGSIAAWLAIVALNAQVRWQNERYTMPAVAWTLLLAALGLGVMLDGRAVLVRRAAEVLRVGRGWARALFAARAAMALGLLVLFLWHQEPRMRDQIWFFGRASRNIRDQHVTVGRLLDQMSPRPHRVLVGDAGAVIYASDLPGLDLIGLGGYHDLPFARAGVHGLGATLELIERLPAADRPDYFAIYPSWWGDLPNWFGERIAAVPVHGNVICGGYEKVVYRADWHGLGRGARPITLAHGERVVDELDVADLVSEGEHRYEFPHPGGGFVEARLLSRPVDARTVAPDGSGAPLEMFDAGRRIPEGRAEKFTLKTGRLRRARLVARSAPEHDTDVDVAIDGKPIGTFHFVRADGWREAAINLPPIPTPALPVTEPRAAVSIEVELTPRTGDWVDHHVWALEAP
jgi:hypothetical protein